MEMIQYKTNKLDYQYIQSGGYRKHHKKINHSKKYTSTFRKGDIFFKNLLSGISAHYSPNTGNDNNAIETFFQNVATSMMDHVDNSNGNFNCIDYGGVGEYPLTMNGLDSSPPITLIKGACMFSYFPINDKFATRMHKMEKIISDAGFSYLFVMTIKHGKYGKADMMYMLSKNLFAQGAKNVNYFEDTAQVLDELDIFENNISSKTVTKFWVRPGPESRHRASGMAKNTVASILEVNEFIDIFLTGQM